MIVGVDFGKKHDYTAVAVVEREEPLAAPTATNLRPKPEPAVYRLRALDRIRQVSYTEVTDQIAAQFAGPLKRATLVIDETGPGTGPGDMLVKHKLNPWRVTITGGMQVHRDGHNLSVPKRDLCVTLDTVADQGRLTTVPGLALWPLLESEMTNFKYKILPSGHMTFGAVNDPLDWRDNEHDDLVLAVALAVWFGEKGPARFAARSY